MAQILRAAAITPQLHRHFLSPNPPATAISAVITLGRHFADLRPRGLKLPHQVELETTSEKEKKRRNRSEMKREAREAVRWGMDLASFSTPQIKLILKAAALEKEVFEALMLVKKLGPDVREGKRRQFNYIGKLLRDAQSDLLGALIQATKDGDQSRLQALVGLVNSIEEEVIEEECTESESEQEQEDSGDHITLAKRWLDGLLNKDNQITKEVYSVDSVEFDRQELRRLVRNVQSVQDIRKDDNENSAKRDADLVAAKKALDRFLCSLAKRLLSVQTVVL